MFLKLGVSIWAILSNITKFASAAESRLIQTHRRKNTVTEITICLALSVGNLLRRQTETLRDLRSAVLKSARRSFVSLSLNSECAKCVGTSSHRSPGHRKYAKTAKQKIERACCRRKSVLYAIKCLRRIAQIKRSATMPII